MLEALFPMSPKKDFFIGQRMIAAAAADREKNLYFQERRLKESIGKRNVDTEAHKRRHRKRKKNRYRERND